MPTIATSRRPNYPMKPHYTGVRPPGWCSLKCFCCATWASRLAIGNFGFHHLDVPTDRTSSSQKKIPKPWLGSQWDSSSCFILSTSGSFRQSIFLYTSISFFDLGDWMLVPLRPIYFPVFLLQDFPSFCTSPLLTRQRF